MGIPLVTGHELGSDRLDEGIDYSKVCSSSSTERLVCLLHLVLPNFLHIEYGSSVVRVFIDVWVHTFKYLFT